MGKRDYFRKNLLLISSLAFIFLFVGVLYYNYSNGILMSPDGKNAEERSLKGFLESGKESLDSGEKFSDDGEENPFGGGDPGFCPVACPIGSICCGGTCVVSECFTDADCDDGQSFTNDYCVIEEGSQCGGICEHTFIDEPTCNCNDGTACNMCAPAQPWFCEGSGGVTGELVIDCTICGCPANTACNQQTKSCYTLDNTCQSWGSTEVDYQQSFLLSQPEEYPQYSIDDETGEMVLKSSWHSELEPYLYNNSMSCHYFINETGSRNNLIVYEGISSGGNKVGFFEEENNGENSFLEWFDFAWPDRAKEKDLISLSEHPNYYVHFQGIPEHLDFLNGESAYISFLGDDYRIYSMDLDSSDWENDPPRVHLQRISDGYEIELVNNGAFNNIYDEYGNPIWGVYLCTREGEISWELTCIGIYSNRWFHNEETEQSYLYPPREQTLQGNAQNSENFLEGTNHEKENSAKVFFDGFATTESTDVVFKKGVTTNANAVYYGMIEYSDEEFIKHSIPMAIKLPATSGLNNFSDFIFDNKPVQYSTNVLTNFNSFRLQDYSGNQGAAVLKFNSPTITLQNSILLNSYIGENTQSYRYLVWRGNSGEVFLTLAGYSSENPLEFDGFIDNLADNSGKLFFVGTSLNDENLDVNHNNYKSNLQSGNWKRAYYHPDMPEFFGEQNGDKTGIYKTAIFRVKERASFEDFKDSMPENNAPRSGYVFIDTKNGNSGTVDTKNALTNSRYSGKKTAIEYYQYIHPYLLNPEHHTYGILDKLSEASDEIYYTQAYTDFGTRVSLRERELTLKIPVKQKILFDELYYGPWSHGANLAGEFYDDGRSDLNFPFQNSFGVKGKDGKDYFIHIAPYYDVCDNQGCHTSDKKVWVALHEAFLYQYSQPWGSGNYTAYDYLQGESFEEGKEIQFIDENGNEILESKVRIENVDKGSVEVNYRPTQITLRMESDMWSD